jgi:hypothetical protein
MHRHDHGARAQLLVCDATRDFDPVEPGHADVEHGDAGVQAADDIQSRIAITHGGDDGHVGLSVDDVLQGVAKRRMVVRDDNPDPSRCVELAAARQGGSSRFARRSQGGGRRA